MRLDILSEVQQVLADLVRINSVNPAYEGGVSEAAVADYVQSYFKRYEIQSWQQEVFPGRPNLIARIAGRNPARKLVFEAHMDTVSGGGMSIAPFDPVISEGRLYGRGSCDIKAGLAAILCAAVSLKTDAIVPPSDIWVLAAADEEYSFGGVRRFLKDATADAAVVSEPTMMRIAVAGKGVLRWRIRCQGKAAHSSKPHTGINAITNMAQLILSLERDSVRLQSAEHALLGTATFNIGLIKGGRQVNTVPDLCTIEVDRRLLPTESVPEVLAHYVQIVASISGACCEPPLLEDPAFETVANCDLVRCAKDAAESLGLESTPIGVAFGSDASKFSRAGIPSIICGPGDIDRAHSAAEYVELSQVKKAVEFYRRLMLTFV